MPQWDPTPDILFFCVCVLIKPGWPAPYYILRRSVYCSLSLLETLFPHLFEDCNSYKMTDRRTVAEASKQGHALPASPWGNRCRAASPQASYQDLSGTRRSLGLQFFINSIASEWDIQAREIEENYASLLWEPQLADAGNWSRSKIHPPDLLLTSIMTRFNEHPNE